MITDDGVAEKLQELITSAHSIVIMQADNPDGDSLGSALALEQIFGDMGKDPYLYCGVNIPEYLRHMPGWDRVSNELPAHIDLSVIVDTSADSLFSSLARSNNRKIIAGKPCVIIDHHDTEATIPFATLTYYQPAVATGEVIYELARRFAWPMNLTARNMLAVSIMADSLGLTTEGTSARSIHIIGELVESGVSIAELENRRRELMRKPAEITAYKGELLQRIEYYAEGRIALVHIPWAEIQRYSHAYNPSVLVIDDMRSTIGVAVAVAFKTYSDGRVTAKIRCNFGSPIGADLAEHFGGGGHPYASGFKVEGSSNYEDIKQECIEVATQLLNELSMNHPERTVQ